MVELCAAARVRRLVHVSSVGVYGHVANPPAAEDAPLAPVNTYERTKRAGEEAARKAAAQYGVDMVIVRPSWVYGAGCPRTEKLVGALRRGRFFYIGPARNLRHPVYIDDFLDGVLLAANAGPNVRAGFIAAPVSGPPNRMSIVTARPIWRRLLAMKMKAPAT